MKRVVIGMKNGKPFVVSCPGKIEVVFKSTPRRSLRKLYRTGLYHIRTAWANTFR